MKRLTRRDFLRDLSVSAAATPFLAGLPDLTAASGAPPRKQRLVIMFSPNGTVPEEFWPDLSESGLALKSILKPLEPFKDKTLVLKGINNQIRGDGDSHMRGMSCLLTGTELLPGNIQGGSHTPAGWAGGISIDQAIKNHLQASPETRTRFGSLEFGVAVPNRADPWTRMSYAKANRPLAPVDDPNQILRKLYGNAQDEEALSSVLDSVHGELKRISSKLSSHDRTLLDDHLALVREMETNLEHAANAEPTVHAMPEIDPEIELVASNTPQISRIQIDLLVNSFANDMTRVATLQYMRSVGQARMHWLGINEGHHGLSHEPDKNQEARDKLQKINTWFCGQVAYLARKLSETPEPGGGGTLLDNTLIVWVNELGKGNSHTLNNIPVVVVGAGPGFRNGRALDLGKVPHNRLWLSVAHAMGYHTDSFGITNLCADGALDLA